MAGGVGLIDRYHVFVDMVVVRMVQMSVVQVVDVILVADSRMPATSSMLVGVSAFVDVVGHGHDLTPGRATPQAVGTDFGSAKSVWARARVRSDRSFEFVLAKLLGHASQPPQHSGFHRSRASYRFHRFVDRSPPARLLLTRG